MSCEKKCTVTWKDKNEQDENRELVSVMWPNAERAGGGGERVYTFFSCNLVTVIWMSIVYARKKAKKLKSLVAESA